jgi:hypothetical protein
VIVTEPLADPLEHTVLDDDTVLEPVDEIDVELDGLVELLEKLDGDTVTDAQFDAVTETVSDGDTVFEGDEVIVKLVDEEIVTVAEPQADPDVETEEETDGEWVDEGLTEPDGETVGDTVAENDGLPEEESLWLFAHMMKCKSRMRFIRLNIYNS